MVLIPATDAFTMGSSDGDSDEKPPHRVKLSAFCMDKTEVTVAAYRSCMKEEQNAVKCTPALTTVWYHGYSVDDTKFWSQFCNGDKVDKGTHPINCVDWTQASAYCKWSGSRLPTEAQWEYAARGIDGLKYPLDPPDSKKPGPKLLNICGTECRTTFPRLGKSFANMYDMDDGAETTAPVGTYPDDSSSFGVLDMAGNVREWVADWYAPYKGSSLPPVDPQGPDKPGLQQSRVLRGGGWSTSDPSMVRATYRNGLGAMNRDSSIGFRCARSNIQTTAGPAPIGAKPPEDMANPYR
jgi:formylglycine-generating enzyme required for sulfatase activity